MNISININTMEMKKKNIIAHGNGGHARQSMLCRAGFSDGRQSRMSRQRSGSFPCKVSFPCALIQCAVHFSFAVRFCRNLPCCQTLPGVVCRPHGKASLPSGRRTAKQVCTGEPLFPVVKYSSNNGVFL